MFVSPGILSVSGITVDVTVLVTRVAVVAKLPCPIDKDEGDSAEPASAKAKPVMIRKTGRTALIMVKSSS